MKKALLIALCFILMSLALVNGSFAFPDISAVFQVVEELVKEGFPEWGGAGKAVHVELIAGDAQQILYPGGEVSRSFKVKNLGTGGVCFRLVYAVQYDEESWPMLDVRFAAGSGFIEHDWQDITVGSTPYKMKAFTYASALSAAGTSPEVSISIAMDPAITSEQMARYRGDFLKTQVLAIDPAPFAEKGHTTAEAALDLALPLDKLNPF